MRSYKHAITILVTLAWFAASCTPEGSIPTVDDPRQETKDKVHNAFAPLVSTSDGDHPIYNQIAVGVITGDTVDFYSFYDKSQPGKEVTQDSLFELGAATQVFTALSYTDLLVQKKLGIYDTVDSVLKDSKIPSHEGSKIRIEHLASHFSQLPWLPTNLGVAGPLSLNPFRGYSDDKFESFLAGYELKTTPGLDYRYSVVGMGLLGKVLSNFHNKALPDVLNETVFDALNMPNTRYELSEKQKSKLVQGYFNGLAVDSWDYNALKGAGGLKSSVADLVTFLKAQMNPEGSGLSRAITMSQEPRGQYPLGTMAMGWQIAGRNHPHYYWTAGYTSGSQSYLSFMPDKKRGLIVLSNSVFSKPSDVKAYWLRIHELSQQIMDEISKRPKRD